MTSARDVDEMLADVIGNISIAAQASENTHRYEENALNAIIRDVFLLANSDFLVCTMSSNVCRLAHELRMASEPKWDPPDQHTFEDTISLDVAWHVHGIWYPKYYKVNLRGFFANFYIWYNTYCLNSLIFSLYQ